jgi:putative transposase
MPRVSRVVIPGVAHHVTLRGNRRMQTFFSDADYAAYRGLVADGCRAAGVEVLAYCLMPNHVHLVVIPGTPDGLRGALAGAHRRYTSAINRRQGWTGHLWQARFHSFPMDEAHVLAAVRYVELNPVRARLVDRPEDWPWSSAAAHSAGTGDALIGAHRPPPLDLVGSWAEFLAADPPDDFGSLVERHTVSGRPLGTKTFIARMERQTGLTLRPGPRRRPKKTSTREAENRDCPG